MNQRGFSWIFIVGAVALTVILAGGSYYLGTKRSETFEDRVDRQNPNVWPSIAPQPTDKPSPDTSTIDTDDTTNWKTYANTKAGFSVKYPPDFSVEETYSSPSLNPKYYSESIVYVSFMNKGMFVNIAVAKGKNNFTIDNALGKGPYLSYVDSFLEGKGIQKFTVDGVNAIRVDNIPAGQAGEGSDTIFIKDGKVFQITSTPMDSLKIVDQILPTFKFN